MEPATKNLWKKLQKEMDVTQDVQNIEGVKGKVQSQPSRGASQTARKKKSVEKTPKGDGCVRGFPKYGGRERKTSEPAEALEPAEPARKKKIRGKNSKRRWMCEGISKI